MSVNRQITMKNPAHYYVLSSIIVKQNMIFVRLSFARTVYTSNNNFIYFYFLGFCASVRINDRSLYRKNNSAIIDQTSYVFFILFDVLIVIFFTQQSPLVTTECFSTYFRCYTFNNSGLCLSIIIITLFYSCDCSLFSKK